VCMYVWMYVMHACMYACMCVWMSGCLDVCMSVCLYVFFASHGPQLQLSAESNCYLSASQNETELGNLAAPWSFFVWITE
jgi:hypothetical protein